MLVQHPSAKAEKDGGVASGGPLGDHFSQFTSAPTHRSHLLLELTVELLRKQLSDGVGFSPNPGLGLPRLCLCGFERTRALCRI